MLRGKAVFVYPHDSPNKNTSGNTYISDLIAALTLKGVAANTRYFKYAVLELLLHIRAGIFIINWPENIPKRKFGYVQTLLFKGSLRLIKGCGKKIIWILHNKMPHSGETKRSAWLMDFMAKISHEIITHSSEGVRYFTDRYPSQAQKIRYIPHPVYPKNNLVITQKPYRYDYIIWGGVSKYKGIKEFVQFFYTHPFFKDKTVLICGNCSDKTYEKEILANIIDHRITFVNRFITNDELHAYIEQSRVILFTYKEESVLSSGALIYSLLFNKLIIGPNIGNFVDMSSIVKLFSSFEDICTIDIDQPVNKEAINAFYQENTWSHFVEKLYLCNE